MNSSLQKILEAIKNFWQKLSNMQRILLIGGSLTIIAVGGVLMFWAGQPQYVVLFKDLSTTEAGSITQQLGTMGVKYQLAGTSTIMVPSSNADQIRIDLANAGLPKESTFSFEYINEMRIGETDKDRQLRYMLGLQNELEKSIKLLDDITYARVHIVIPEPSLFEDNTSPSTASVVVKTDPGTELSEDKVRSIANLLAYSVKGLAITDISITDTQGRVLSEILSDGSSKMTGTQYEHKLEYERKIESNLRSLLEAVYGQGTVLVRASADLDFDSRKVIDETHGSGALVSRQETAESVQSNATSGGVPGESTNIPDYVISDSGSGNTSSEKTSVTENFQVDTRQEESIIAPGQVRRLTISVLADADAVSSAESGAIQSAAEAAVGIDMTRGDILEVALLPFNKTATQQAQAEIEAALQRERLMSYLQMGLIAGVIMTGLIIILISRRRRKKTALEGDIDIEARLENAGDILSDQARMESEANMKLAQMKMKSSEDFEREKISKEIDDYVDQSPDEVAKLIKAWLTTGEE